MRILVIDALFSLAIVGLVLWVAQQLINYVPEPPRRILWIAIVVIAVIFIFRIILGLMPVIWPA